jgi:hypothetical protein
MNRVGSSLCLALIGWIAIAPTDGAVSAAVNQNVEAASTDRDVQGHWVMIGGAGLPYNFLRSMAAYDGTVVAAPELNSFYALVILRGDRWVPFLDFGSVGKLNSAAVGAAGSSDCEFYQIDVGNYDRYLVYAGGTHCTCSENSALRRLEDSGWAVWLGCSTPACLEQQTTTACSEVRWFKSLGTTIVAVGRIDNSPQRLIEWRDGQWMPVGPARDGLISDVALFQGSFVIAAQEQLAGAWKSRVLQLGTGGWHDVGATATPSPEGSLAGVTVYRGALIAFGGFTSVDGMEATGIAAWDGTSWSPLGTGVDGGAISSVVEYQSNLIVSGTFLAAGGMPAPGLALWDGRRWQALQGFPEALPARLHVLNDRLYASNWSAYVYEGTLVPAATVALSAHAEPGANLVTWSSAHTAQVDSAWLTRWVNGHEPQVVRGWGDGVFPLTGQWLDTDVRPGYVYRYRMEVSTGGGVLASADAQIARPSARSAIVAVAPNPFNPQTEIRCLFAMPGPARLRVLDASGRVVRTLLDAVVSPGLRDVAWDGRDDAGRPAASGAYRVVLENHGERDQASLVLVR